jgi:hypothetical protein
MITENTPRGSGGGVQGQRATERTRAPSQYSVRVSMRTARRARAWGGRGDPAIIARCQQEGDGTPDEGRVCQRFFNDPGHRQHPSHGAPSLTSQPARAAGVARRFLTGARRVRAARAGETAPEHRTPGVVCGRVVRACAESAPQTRPLPRGGSKRKRHPGKGSVMREGFVYSCNSLREFPDRFPELFLRGRSGKPILFE